MLDIPSFIEPSFDIEAKKINTDHVKRPLMVAEILNMDLFHESKKRGEKLDG